MSDVAGLLDHPTTRKALGLVRAWTRDRPSDPPAAVRHALRVVDTLRRHVLGVAPEVLAAVLLQDAEELAPTAVDLDAVLPAVSPEVARLVWLLGHEHDELHAGRIPDPPSHDPPLLQASAADKLVTARAVVAGAARGVDPAAYWASIRGSWLPSRTSGGSNKPPRLFCQR